MGVKRPCRKSVSFCNHPRRVGLPTTRAVTPAMERPWDACRTRSAIEIADTRECMSASPIEALALASMVSATMAELRAFLYLHCCMFETAGSCGTGPSTAADITAVGLNCCLKCLPGMARVEGGRMKQIMPVLRKRIELELSCQAPKLKHRQSLRLCIMSAVRRQPRNVQNDLLFIHSTGRRRRRFNYLQLAHHRPSIVPIVATELTSLRSHDSMCVDQ